jgi:hypothetical protein
MSRLLEIFVVGLAIILIASASALHCVAQSGNGATGRADRIILERAQWVAMHLCAVREAMPAGTIAASHGRLAICLSSLPLQYRPGHLTWAWAAR